MDGSRRVRCGRRLLRLALLLAGGAAGGCAAFSNPTAYEAIPVHRLPAEVFGLPAWRPEGDEPWLYDARIMLRLRPRSGRRRA